MEQKRIFADLEVKEHEAQPFNFRKIVDKAIGIWPWMLLGAVICGILAAMYLYFAEPKYKVNAKILIKDDDAKPSSSMGSDISMLQSLGVLAGASNVNNELEIIKSYTLMNQVVNDLQLNVFVSVEDNLRIIELYGNQNPFLIRFTNFNKANLKEDPREYEIGFLKEGKLQVTSLDSNVIIKVNYGDIFEIAAGTLSILPNPEFTGDKSESYTLKVANPDLVTGYYMNSLEAIIPNRDVSTISLSLNSTVPVKGENVLNTLIDAYMQANVDDNNRIADSTMSFIDSRLLVVSDQLTDIEKKIQTFKQDNEVADLSAQAQALISNTGDYAKQVAAQEVQLNVIESLEEYLKANADKPRIVPASLLVQDATLSSIVQQYNSLLMQRSRLLLGNTESSPIVRNVDEQLTNLRLDMLKGVTSVKQSAQAALHALKQNSNQLEAQIRRVPAKERVYLDFSRQQQIRQELYLFLLQKREETAISRSSTIANARIIDKAKAEEMPYEPKKKLILAAAVLLGIVLPFGIVYTRDLLTTQIKTKDDINSECSLPIIGEIGHNEKEDFIVVSPTSRAIVAEQFRALRTNLQFLLPEKDDKVIMFTSSMSGEGKSFISTNLSMVFALAGKKVILLELDLRKPKIMSSLNITYSKGFSNYAIGAANLEEIILPSGIHENLFIMPAGPIPPNPSELILHDRTANMFRSLKEKFDYIIIDTTPNLVSDAQLLSVYAQATLYVARLDYTRKEQLHLADSLLKEGKMPRLSLVINDIKLKRYGGGYYGYGYGYGKGYGYGDYIEENKGKRK